MMRERGFDHAGFFMLRAPALPADRFADVLHPARRRAAAAEPLVEQALHVASTDLADRLTQADAGDRRSRRIDGTLLRYLTRMTTRPTPFGLFAGVALGTFGMAATARLGAAALGRTRTRADMGWLLALVRDAERRPETLLDLHVTANPTLYEAGGRLILPHADVYAAGDDRSIAVRATVVVRRALEIACTPVPYGDVLHELAQSFPAATAEQIAALVRQLWDLHVLVSDLRPPSTDPHPERYVLKRLCGVDALAGTAAAVEQVVAAAEVADDPATRGAAALRELRRRQLALVPGHKGPTYQVDAALDITAAELPAVVGEAVADAADTLMRIGCYVPRLPHLAEYHAAFLERYGLDTEVPLLELLTPESGLDAPPTYQYPGRTYPLRSMPLPDRSGRDQLLAAFAAEAFRSGQREVAVTDEYVARFARVPHPPYPPAVDVFVQLEAASLAAVEAGDWRAVLLPAGTAPGGRTFGRFLDLLDAAATERLRAYTRREEALDPDAVHAELSYLPPFGKGANVAIRPLLRRYEIPVGTPPSATADFLIGLDDIVVGASLDRFVLRSRRLGRRLVVTQGHMLTPQRSPNYARFLLEASADGYGLPTGFDWGPMIAAPYLPRVVRDRVVLHPAQWNVNLTTLLDGRTDAGPAEVRDAVAAWRERYRVPRHVYCAETDNRLLLDLESPASVAVFEAELRRSHRQQPRVLVAVHEMLPGFDRLWLRDTAGRGYVAELVVPLLARRPPVTDERPAAAPGLRTASPGYRPVVPVADRRRLPGDEWAFLKLYSALKQHDDVLTGRLPALLDGLSAAGLLADWFFIRYLDPEPHLRLRLRAADPEAMPQVIDGSLRWARTVVADGLARDVALAGYEREVERYGGPALIGDVERVFHANSVATVQLLAALPAAGVDPVRAGVLALDTLYAQWGLTTAQRLSAVPPADEPDGVRKEFHAVRGELGELLVPWDAHPAPAARTQRAALLPVLAPQEPAVRAAAARVAACAADGDLGAAEHDILATLAHMQINRLLGVDREVEARCYALWRNTLGSILRRPDGTERTEAS